MSDQVLERPPAAMRDTTLAPPRPGLRLARPSRRRLAVAGIIVLLTASTGYYGDRWWNVGRFIDSTDDAYVGGDITAIAPKVAGLIAEVAVTDNQQVHAGDLLVRLDDRDFRAAVQKAEAVVTGAQAKLANLAASRKLQLAVIAESEADLVSTAAEITRTRADVDRYRTLSQDQNASQQRFQQADADAKKASAADAKAHAARDAAKDQIDVIDSARLEAEAALAGATADLATARLNLSYTELRAPVDGMIGNRSAEVGIYATIGANLLSLVPARGLWVDANFKENQLAALQPGLPATIAADVLPGQVFHGHVASLAPATGATFSVLPPENATGNFTKIVQRVPVRILLDGDAGTLGRLRPGLSATVDIDLRAAAETKP